MKTTTLFTNCIRRSLGRSALLFVSFLIGCFALLPTAHAVSPAPDGGYPGFTTAEGQNALSSLTTGQGNTGVGWYSLFTGATNNLNTAVGVGTLVLNTADNNTAVGAAALFSNTTGRYNTANGDQALQNNTAGHDNTANGALALVHNTTGSGNTAVGSEALDFNVGGSGNIALGVEAGFNVTTASNVICIGAFGNNVDNSCYIGNIFGSTSSNGTAVFVNTNGRLGTMTSSRRFKDEIKPMDKSSEAVLALKPVTFRYKKEIDATGTSQFGLVAEEVEKVNRDLVVRDKEGKPYSVRYDQVNAMLLNEFLKEHKAFVQEQRKVQEQDATISRLQKQVEALTMGLQKVSAQLELSKPAPRTVLNDR